MKAKNLLLTLAVGAMAISCNNSGSMTQTSASLKTTADSASFYIGYMYGSGPVSYTHLTLPTMVRV